MNDYSNRCAVSIKNGRVLITSVVGTRDAVACPSPASPVPVSGARSCADTDGEVEAPICTEGGGAKSESNKKNSETAECKSESEDSIDEESLIDSTEAPGEDSIADELSDA